MISTLPPKIGDFIIEDGKSYLLMKIVKQWVFPSKLWAMNVKCLTESGIVIDTTFGEIFVRSGKLLIVRCKNK